MSLGPRTHVGFVPKQLEIHEAVIKLLKQPELAFLSSSNREDIIACLTLSMIEVALTANPGLVIDVALTERLVIKQYYETFNICRDTDLAH